MKKRCNRHQQQQQQQWQRQHLTMAMPHMLGVRVCATLSARDFQLARLSPAAAQNESDKKVTRNNNACTKGKTVHIEKTETAIRTGYQQHMNAKSLPALYDTAANAVFAGG
jgi:hypothetical protein